MDEPESLSHTMLISIPPKYAVSRVVGYIKGKSAIHLARVYGERKRSFVGQHFWARGFFVSTVGRDACRGILTPPACCFVNEGYQTFGAGTTVGLGIGRRRPGAHAGGQPAERASGLTVTNVAGDNIICDTTVTTDTAFPTNQPNDRVYPWPALPGFGVIDAATIVPSGGNTVISGFGLEFDGRTGGGSGTDVIFNHVDTSSMFQSAVPTLGNSAQTGALSLITAGGGNIIYTGNGSISARWRGRRRHCTPGHDSSGCRQQ